MQRRAWVAVTVLTVIVVLPLLAALVSLLSTRWYPVLDLAMTELRVRDVFGRHSPLIGLPGRIGESPDRGSHPGPLSFWMLAPTYRLSGASAWGMLAGTVVIHSAAVATAVAIGWRRRGVTGACAVAALMALLVHGYGQDVLIQPWNPYLPLLAWVVLLLAGWSILDGDAPMAVVMVVAGSLCAQTHVPYLLLAASLTIGGLLWTSRSSPRWAAIATGVGVLLWLPPLIDQMVRSPGNIRRLISHFRHPNEELLGVREGVELALRHFDMWNGIVGRVAGSNDVFVGGRFVVDSSPWIGALTVVVWIVAFAYACRHGPRSLVHLHVVVGAAALVGTASITRIFGLPWYYLTLWAWATATLAVGATLWSALVALRHAGLADIAVARRAATVAAIAVTALATVAALVAFLPARVPEPRMSAIVAGIADDTAAALDPGVRYVVRWSDAADMGSPGYGLLNELERRGFVVGADPYFRDTVTLHRAMSDPEMEIHLATGGYIGAWRELPTATEVATYIPPGFAAATEAGVRERLIERLIAEGLPDLVAGVDDNLFGTSLDQRLSDAARADFRTLLDAGQPVAVFVAPPGADPLSL